MGSIPTASTNNSPRGRSSRRRRTARQLGARPHSFDGLAAVHDDRRAGHEIRGGGGQEEHGRRQLLRRAQAPERDAALDLLAELPGKKLAVLGDMLELGARAEELHEEIGGLIAATGVEMLFLRGVFSGATSSGAVKKGFPVSRIFYPSTPEEILKVLSSSLKKGDWILVKGSRAKKMEEVIKIIIEEFGLEGGLTNGLHQFGHCYLGG